MKEYIVKDPWKIIESKFHPEYNRITESLCSLGNGFFGQRGNFDEYFSGDSLQGNYISGIYYPDKTRVGWWKNGYPDYFAKVLNAVNWIGVDIWINKQRLDLATCNIISFNRTLNMREGILYRHVELELPKGERVKIDTQRFCSYASKEIGCSRYEIEALDEQLNIKIRPYLDFDVKNEDANYDEQFWVEIEKVISEKGGCIIAKTKKTAFEVCATYQYNISASEKTNKDRTVERENFIGHDEFYSINAGERLVLEKFVSITTSFHHPQVELKNLSNDLLKINAHQGFDKCKSEHISAWEAKWEESDITIEGDIAAQQAIRFNIFHLNQTYTGENPKLNIGPKGFTGEKYGGSTYWDTEAYCLPFYLSTAPPQIAKNLLVYRYQHLQKAIENATKLGFKDGAALYPMVTMNGEECHNEWEITFEEIHRNAAIAYAIYDYIRYTNDASYLEQAGLEVLIGIARFWAQRVNWSSHKDKYVILGVTGPNEYENNVNNNWYTNVMATWCLEYATECINHVKGNEKVWSEIKVKTNFQENEIEKWTEIRDKIYLPNDKALGIKLQQDGFLDKVISPASEIPAAETPINQHWSWDRILRSCYIKQADVLQGMYFLEDRFSKETIEKNFEFYEPITVHESSLSPCVHAILACSIGKHDKAYEMYLRTARLDIDDYNNDTEDGLHITSMAGTWMSIVKGFAGMRVKDDMLSFRPHLPQSWKSFAFKIIFRNRKLDIRISKGTMSIKSTGSGAIDLMINDQVHTFTENTESTIQI